MTMMGGERWTQLGSTVAGLMFFWAMFQQFFPFELKSHVAKNAQKLLSFVYPYIEIIFHDYSGNSFERSKAYAAIERYLDKISSTRAKRLRAEMVMDSQSLVLSMDDDEEITDEFNGIQLWWASSKSIPKTHILSFHGNHDERRYYKLTFHRRHRDIITKSYLNHVLDEGKAITVKTRQRKLYTNNRTEQWVGQRRTMWSHIVFEHPATFETLAMEPNRKREIINDLITFTKAKDYYAKIGKAWKRGYLLHGPPGTGKSTMVAAMANLLEYDVYDLDLTMVNDNTELRKLLIETSSKSIIVIEDIDCSLDLTIQRKEGLVQKKKDEEENKSTKVTLSGLLNSIDGLWSACGGERIFIFTTNYVQKLDPALIRRGRMDMHIELSYCCFEAFKALARNYLDLESHHLFSSVRQLFSETKMTPADVAENLMPKSAEEDADTCLETLIKALETTKEEARLKAKEEERLKVEIEKEKKVKEGAQKSTPAVYQVKENKETVEEVIENGVIT